jgi:hypothetical protein
MHSPRGRRCADATQFTASRVDLGVAPLSVALGKMDIGVNTRCYWVTLALHIAGRRPGDRRMRRRVRIRCKRRQPDWPPSAGPECRILSARIGLRGPDPVPTHLPLLDGRKLKRYRSSPMGGRESPISQSGGGGGGPSLPFGPPAQQVPYGDRPVRAASWCSGVDLCQIVHRTRSRCRP